jgi:RNA polymerase sigma factor (sigma-70 family)
MSDARYLIKQSIAGSAPAFEELITPHLVQLQKWLSFVLDDDAEDCLQEVLLSAWLSLASLNDPDRFQGWLFQIARHKSLDFLRKRKRKDLVETPLGVVEGYLSRQPDHGAVQILNELNAPLSKSDAR